MTRETGSARRSRLAGTVAMMALALGGCVGRLETTPYRDQTSNLNGALRGVTYSLPKLQYEIELTRFLTQCPGELDDEGKPTALKFGLEVAGTPQYMPGEAYTVNYHRLAGLLRTSNFEIKYWPNGTLKSLGAGGADKTADVIRDVVKTGLAIASTVSGVGAAGGAVGLAAGTANSNFIGVLSSSEMPSSGVAIMGCTVAAKKFLKRQRALGDDIESRTATLADLVTNAERILARAAVRLKNDADREDLIKLFDRIDAEETAIADAKEELAAIAEELGVTQTIVWNSNMEAVAKQRWNYALSADQQAKLALLLAPMRVAQLSAGDLERRKLAPNCFGAGLDPAKCVSQHLDLRAGIALRSHLAKCDESNRPPECAGTAGPTFRRDTASRDSINRQYRDARDSKPDSGIFVREPVLARLVFCRSAALVGDGPCTSAADEGKMKEDYFPQLGQLRYLPLRIGTFQARNMSIALADDGRVESFSYASTQAAAAGLAAAAADAAGQVDAALEKIETERRSDRAYAREQEVAATQAEITRLTKEAELKALQTPAVAPAPNPLQATLDETTVLNAEIALLKAKLLKLQAARELSEAQP